MSAHFAIDAIEWDRVHLSIGVDLGDAVPDDVPVAFGITSAQRTLPVESVDLGGGRYRLTITITNFVNRSQVPDGTYRIVTLVPQSSEPLVGDVITDDLPPMSDDGRVPGRSASLELSRLGELDAASRTFLYAGNTVSYSVTFDITEDDDPEFLLRAYQMFRKAGRGPAAVRPTLRQRAGKRARARLLPRSRKIKIANQAYRAARRLDPPTGNRILFASEMRASMQGNLARVHERMVERGLDERYQIRTSFRTPQTYTKQGTARLIRLIATSDIVIIDDYFGIIGSLQLDPSTKVIQAWHAGSGFKSIGFSRFGNYGSPRLQNAHRKYTYAITGSRHLVPVYAEAFGIEPAAVIPTGLPRIDTFLDAERTARVVADFDVRHPQLAGKRKILFAPTFRGRGALDAFYDYDRIDFDALYEMCGEDTVIMFRMHHFVHEPVPIPARHADRFVDLSDFPDGNDLLHVTDLLITDYSSIIYEYSLLDRPMLFFAYDEQVYAATRGFHRDYVATAPGKVCASTDELIKAIQAEDFETWRIEAFRRDNFDQVDTHSADRFIDWLILGDPHTSRSASAHAEPDDEEDVLDDAELGDAVPDDTVPDDTVLGEAEEA